MRYFVVLVLMTAALMQPLGFGQEDRGTSQTGAERASASDGQTTSIEEETQIHRLSSTKRSPFDAFTYVNRIPEKPEEGESDQEVAGRIFGRLANQEGRVLLKVPPGMDRKAYNGFKTFLRYEGTAKFGNCAACHTLPEFTDSKLHVVVKGGSPKRTPSLRNLKTGATDLRNVVLAKMAASIDKRNSGADEIDDAYARVNISQEDADELVAFMKLLKDVSDQKFRELILKSELLDTSAGIE